MKVQLLYFQGCPHVEQARERLIDALTASQLPLEFEEIDTGAANSPEHLRRWGSPTILVDGRDVGGGGEPTGIACLLYRSREGGFEPAPTVDTIREGLHAACTSNCDPA